MRWLGYLTGAYPDPEHPWTHGTNAGYTRRNVIPSLLGFQGVIKIEISSSCAVTVILRLFEGQAISTVMFMRFLLSIARR